MKSFYSISIPKPCHENWNEMTPNEKGRFCGSCAKTVIDFTKMTPEDIQNILHENRNNRICGHIRQEQLDAINLQIPIESISSQMNFHKMFFIALLIAMGTTLLNCKNSNDKVQKINSVEVVDSISIIGKPLIHASDSLVKDTINKPKMPNPLPPPPLLTPTGIVVSTLGNMKTESQAHDTDSINQLTVDGEMEIYTENIVLGFIEVANPPEFKDTPKNLSVNEKRDYFKNKMTEFVSHNFSSPQDAIEIKGKQRIAAIFTIDEKGKIKNIKVKAAQRLFEKEVIRVLKLLPPFVPAKQRGQNVSVSYSLPIIFQAED